MDRIRIATRSSPQARAQSEHVGRLIAAACGAEVEYVAVDTAGDVNQTTPLHRMGGTGIFVKEVQNAVLDGRADVAVHSAKDLPSEPHPGLVIGAVGERRTPNDALVGRSLADLAPGATVATGSVRRRAQLRRVRPDLEFVELRGNIQTRLSKVPDGGAVVMAVAALEILGLTERVAEVLDLDTAVPMVGQGSVAVEARRGDDAVLAVLAGIDHAPSRRAVMAERSFLAELGAGCSVPVAAHLATDGTFRAFMADDAGVETVQLTGDVGVEGDRRAEGAAMARECRALLARR